MAANQPTLTRAMSRVMAKPVFRWMMLLYVVVILAFAVASFFSSSLLDQELLQYTLQSQQEELDNRVSAIEETLTNTADTELMLDQIRESLVLAEQLQVTDHGTLLDRLDDLEASVRRLNDGFGDLKSILNPGSPEELLTVLRLADKLEFVGMELESLSAEVSRVRQDVDGRIERNYERTVAHAKAETGSIKWLALLLVPALLNTLRDLLPRRTTRNSDEG